MIQPARYPGLTPEKQPRMSPRSSGVTEVTVTVHLTRELRLAAEMRCIAAGVARMSRTTPGNELSIVRFGIAW